MTPVATNDQHLSDLSRPDSAAAAKDRPWLTNLRKAATDHFAAVGFPTAQQEEWRFTNFAPITRTKFFPAPAQPSEESRELAAQAGFRGDAAAELVFVNGHYAPSLSRPGKLPRGASLSSLAHAMAGDGALLERHFAHAADIQHNSFVALNTAQMRDGAILHVSRGVALDGPVHLLYISTSGADPTQSHPRALVVAEDNSELTVVESFIGGAGAHFSNAVTEIFAGDDARIEYNRIQLGGEQTLAVSALAARLNRGSRLISHCATIGGKLTRNDLSVVLDGKAADATLNGLVVLRDQQHCDNHTLLDHAAANCPSHELYKHVLDGRASCVFRGKILVRPDSQKTDSKQTSKSLLLSDDAQMNSQPALEIYADDVKCTHGSTTGPVDEEMVFYLRSRGVSAEAARHLLTYAFAADITRRIKVEPVRRRLEDFLAAQHGLPRDLRITDVGEHDEKAR